MPSSFAAWLMARPWLPVEAETTPRERSAGASERSLLRAPRSLNEPVIWSHSHLTWTSAPNSRLSGSDSSSGVRRMSASILPRASGTLFWKSQGVSSWLIVLCLSQVLFQGKRRRGIRVAVLRIVTCERRA